MKPRMKKDLVAASAEPLILALLLKGESYGYAIMQAIHAESAEQIEWTDGMLYPVLHRLERQGAVRSRWRESETGRKRKYYAIKSQGRDVLEEHKSQWLAVNRVLENLWRPHVQS